jgi:hypothetical protein
VLCRMQCFNIVATGSSTVMLKEEFLKECAKSFRTYDGYKQVKFYDECKAKRPEYKDFVVAPSHDVV